MSLDIVILGADGTPKRQVSIGVDDHHKLMNLVEDHPAVLLSRIKDYYGDAEFGAKELEQLIREVNNFRERSRDAGLVSFLTALVELAEAAKLGGQPLVAIAD